MERFVYDLKWQSRLSWTIAIAMFLAVGVFGAPPMTIAGVITAELLFITFITRRYPYRKDHHSR